MSYSIQMSINIVFSKMKPWYWLTHPSELPWKPFSTVLTQSLMSKTIFSVCLNFYLLHSMVYRGSQQAICSSAACFFHSHYLQPYVIKTSVILYHTKPSNHSLLRVLDARLSLVHIYIIQNKVCCAVMRMQTCVNIVSNLGISIVSLRISCMCSLFCICLGQ